MFIELISNLKLLNMKKHTIPALIAFVMLFTACQKESKKLSDQDVVITKINSWLDSRLQANNETVNATILQLKANLDFTQLWDEEYRDRSKFIIVPLKAGFVSKNNKGKSPSNNLVLAIDEAGEITNANIIQYVPANGKPGVQIPRNALSKMYNGKPVMDEGKFSYSNLADRLLYELDFKDGRINKFGLIKAGPAKGTSRGMIEQDPIGDCVMVD